MGMKLKSSVKKCYGFAHIYLRLLNTVAQRCFFVWQIRVIKKWTPWEIEKGGFEAGPLNCVTTPGQTLLYPRTLTANKQKCSMPCSANVMPATILRASA